MRKFADSAKAFIHEWTLNILILVFGTTTLLQAFIVPTPSMDRSVMVGDHLIVDKLSYAPPGPVSKYLLPYTEVKRGDVIVFRWPVDIRQNYVKRVIGIPGDRIKIVDKTVYINGKAIQEPYKQHIFSDLQPYRDTFPMTPHGPVDERGMKMIAEHVVGEELVVPPESYFAMGDNRDNSLDSRYWGFVPRENIIGKPLFIFWSYDAPTENLVGYSVDHLIDLATNFFTKTRWERTFKLIRGYPIQ